MARLLLADCLLHSGSCDATAKLWDWRMPAVPAITFQGHDSDINSVSFCPSGEAFVTGSDDSTCHFFDTRCLLCINKFKSERTICGITSVCSSASGRLLFCGMDNFNCYCSQHSVSCHHLPSQWP
mmetsp:Transcript_25668/g.83206  ORF Transcript_25668/g.83206 Transcript_25668/m.83206 type:complete len:125 (-) Transcript_25668:604-978(-)